MFTILIVDNDTEIRIVLQEYLRNEGYAVLEAADGIEALQMMKSNTVHLVILELMMPRMDGIKTYLKIRETSMLPVILLSAKEEDIDIITGLTIVSDDYLKKPFHPQELLARVKAQLRSHCDAEKEADGSLIFLQDLIINKIRHSVTLRGTEISLTPLELSILLLFASPQGQVFNVDKIYETISNELLGYSEYPRFVQSTYNIAIHLKRLFDDLFEYARLKNSDNPIPSKSVDLQQLLGQILVEFEPLAQKRGITLVKNLGDTPVIASIDSSKLGRAIDILLMNALKYSINTGNVHVTLKSDNQRYYIEMESISQPITKEQEDKLFHRFNKADYSENRSNNQIGSGLGLSIARQLIELHGGVLKLTSMNGIYIFSIAVPYTKPLMACREIEDRFLDCCNRMDCDVI
ncbi:MAG: transcriptional regulator [Paenibacillaceae bacterium]|jgi:DNA-binding response OmpR family regulator/two-component sensor histidine kinase|nr:transcriptional regulator [Paenibacillaceae bacterium]